MSGLAFLLEPHMAPFTGALMLVAGLLIVELIMSLIGLSLMGDGADGADSLDGFEADADFGVDGIDGADAADGLDAAEIDVGEIELGEVDVADLDGADGMDAPSAGGIAAWLGFGQVPFILWLAGLLTAFGITGFFLQQISMGTIGATLPIWAAIPIALLPSLKIGGWFARTLGRLVPKTETSAINRRSLGDRRGVIAQGTARRGQPAQARVKDGFGNTHYVRVEPVDDGVEIPTGTEVLIRGGRSAVLLAIPISDAPADPT